MWLSDFLKIEPEIVAALDVAIKFMALAH